MKDEQDMRRYRESWGMPACECGQPGCRGELPAAAWEFAGFGGIGKGPVDDDGPTDLSAVLTNHVREWHNVVEHRDGYVGAIDSRKL